MLCIWDKRKSSTFLIFIRSSGLVLRKTLKLFSPYWVLNLLCSLHCVTVDHGPQIYWSWSQAMKCLSEWDSACIMLWGAGVEIQKPVGCACDSFSCGRSNLLCLWLTGLTDRLQGLLLRVRPVAGIKMNTDFSSRAWSSSVGLAGSLGHCRNWERALPIDVAVQELPSSKECRSAPGAWTELAIHSTIDFLSA